jgi:hypothetical protein
MVTWRIEKARNGRPALVRPDGSWAESRFAPDVDAERRVLDAGVSSGESVLLIGCGAGELPRVILEAIGSAGRLVIAEPCSAAFVALRDSPFGQKLFQDSRVEFLTFSPEESGESGESAESEFSRGREARVRSAATPFAFYALLAEARECDRFLAHPGLTVPPGLEALRERMDDIEIRRRSSARFREDVDRNMALNRERFLAAPGVVELDGMMAGREIIVAGGGPSLETIAARIGPDADWIAVGRALRPLLLHGIRPHLVVLTDPQAIAAEQILCVPEADRPPLVAFPTSASAAVLASRSLIAAFAEGDGGRRFEPLRAEIGELPAGGTVVTTAIGLAVRLGARRVFLAGVDLVEPRGRSHTRGTTEESAVGAALERFGSMEGGRLRRARSLEERGELVPCELSDGSAGVTRRNFLLYGRAIAGLARRHPDVEFVQLADDALRIDGVRAGAAAEYGCDRARREPFSVPTGTRMRKNRDVPWNL